MTEPLTPPECDLRGLSFMPLDLVRLIDSDLYALSSGDEFKAAVTLWARSWLQVPAASLPDDDRVLAHLSGAGSKWKKVKAMALRGFVKCGDGRLYHPVVAEKAKEAWAHRLKQREKANRRWQERGNPTANANASPAAQPTANAAASPAAMQGTGTGTGTGTGKEDSSNQDRTITRSASRRGPYAFEGAVIRLNQADFDKWAGTFSAIPDLAAELTSLDAWLSDQPDDQRKRWFHVTAGALAKKHQARLEERKTGRSTGFIPLAPGGG